MNKRRYEIVETFIAVVVIAGWLIAYFALTGFPVELPGSAPDLWFV